MNFLMGIFILLFATCCGASKCEAAFEIALLEKKDKVAVRVCDQGWLDQAMIW
jgi:hypothetical protein